MREGSGKRMQQPWAYKKKGGPGCYQSEMSVPGPQRHGGSPVIGQSPFAHAPVP